MKDALLFSCPQSYRDLFWGRVSYIGCKSDQINVSQKVYWSMLAFEIFSSIGMNIVGSLCFCSECGSLLDLSSSLKTIRCGHCKALYSTNGELCQLKYLTIEFSTLEITTRSCAKAFPSALRTKRSAIQTKINQEGPARAKAFNVIHISDHRSMKSVQTARIRRCYSTLFNWEVRTKVHCSHTPSYSRHDRILWMWTMRVPQY